MRILLLVLFLKDYHCFDTDRHSWQESAKNDRREKDLSSRGFENMDANQQTME